MVKDNKKSINLIYDAIKCLDPYDINLKYAISHLNLAINELRKNEIRLKSLKKQKK
jgi:hypothetical protein